MLTATPPPPSPPPVSNNSQAVGLNAMPIPSLAPAIQPLPPASPLVGPPSQVLPSPPTLGASVGVTGSQPPLPFASSSAALGLAPSSSPHLVAPSHLQPLPPQLGPSLASSPSAPSSASPVAPSPMHPLPPPLGFSAVPSSPPSANLASSIPPSPQLLAPSHMQPLLAPLGSSGGVGLSQPLPSVAPLPTVSNAAPATHPHPLTSPLFPPPLQTQVLPTPPGSHLLPSQSEQAPPVPLQAVQTSSLIGFGQQLSVGPASQMFTTSVTESTSPQPLPPQDRSLFPVPPPPFPVSSARESVLPPGENPGSFVFYVPPASKAIIAGTGATTSHSSPVGQTFPAQSFHDSQSSGLTQSPLPASLPGPTTAPRPPTNVRSAGTASPALPSPLPTVSTAPLAKMVSASPYSSPGGTGGLGMPLPPLPTAPLSPSPHQSTSQLPVQCVATPATSGHSQNLVSMASPTSPAINGGANQDGLAIPSLLNFPNGLYSTNRAETTLQRLEAALAAVHEALFGKMQVLVPSAAHDYDRRYERCELQLRELWDLCWQVRSSGAFASSAAVAANAVAVQAEKQRQLAAGEEKNADNFFVALDHQSQELTRQLVTSGVVSTSEPHPRTGETPLDFAVLRGRKHSVQTLLSLAADVSKCRTDVVALGAAARAHGMDDFLLQLRGRSHSQIGKDELLSAVADGDYQKCAHLLQLLADANAWDATTGFSVLEWAVQHEREDVAMLLLDKRAGIEAANKSLHRAAASGLKKLVISLLASKADALMRDEQGWTVLDWAVTEGCGEELSVQFGLDQGWSYGKLNSGEQGWFPPSFVSIAVHIDVHSLDGSTFDISENWMMTVADLMEIVRDRWDIPVICQQVVSNDVIASKEDCIASYCRSSNVAFTIISSLDNIRDVLSLRYGGYRRNGQALEAIEALITLAKREKSIGYEERCRCFRSMQDEMHGGILEYSHWELLCKMALTFESLPDDCQYGTLLENLLRHRHSFFWSSCYDCSDDSIALLLEVLAKFASQADAEGIETICNAFSHFRCRHKLKRTRKRNEVVFVALEQIIEQRPEVALTVIANHTKNNFISLSWMNFLLRMKLQTYPIVSEAMVQKMIVIGRRRKKYTEKELAAVSQMIPQGDEYAISILLGHCREHIGNLSEISDKACFVLGHIEHKGDECVITVILDTFVGLFDRRRGECTQELNCIVRGLARVACKGHRQVLGVLLSASQDLVKSVGIHSSQTSLLVSIWDAIGSLATKADTYIIDAALAFLRDPVIHYRLLLAVLGVISRMPERGDIHITAALIALADNIADATKVETNSAAILALRKGPKDGKCNISCEDIKHIASDRQRCRAKVVGMIGWIAPEGHMGAISILLPLISDETLRELATVGLAKLSPKGDNKVIEAFLLHLAHDKSAPACVAKALNVVAPLGNDPTISSVLSILISAKETRVIKMAIELLAKVSLTGDARAIAAISPRLLDNDSSVQGVAARALTELLPDRALVVLETACSSRKMSPQSLDDPCYNIYG